MVTDLVLGDRVTVVIPAIDRQNNKDLWAWDGAAGVIADVNRDRVAAHQFLVLAGEGNSKWFPRRMLVLVNDSAQD